MVQGGWVQHESTMNKAGRQRKHAELLLLHYKQTNKKYEYPLDCKAMSVEWGQGLTPTHEQLDERIRATGAQKSSYFRGRVDYKPGGFLVIHSATPRRRKGKTKTNKKTTHGTIEVRHIFPEGGESIYSCVLIGALYLTQKLIWVRRKLKVLTTDKTSPWLQVHNEKYICRRLRVKEALLLL